MAGQGFVSGGTGSAGVARAPWLAKKQRPQVDQGMEGRNDICHPTQTFELLAKQIGSFEVDELISSPGGLRLQEGALLPLSQRWLQLRRPLSRCALEMLVASFSIDLRGWRNSVAPDMGGPVCPDFCHIS